MLKKENEIVSSELINKASSRSISNIRGLVSAVI